MDERGIDLLLLVALQVSVERTSLLPKFLITSSFRATPFLTVTVLLLTSFSSRYQDTVGVGLPERKKRWHKTFFHAQFPNYFFLISYSRPRIFLSRGSLFWKDPLIAVILFFSFSFLSPTVSARVETYGVGFVRFIIRFFSPSLWWVLRREEESRLYRVYERGNWNESQRW